MRVLIELLVAPGLVAISTLAARRWGDRAGGVLSAFPAIVGPVLLILAMSHGQAFAARAANGTLLGLVSLAAFALGYGQLARRSGWSASLFVGWAGAAMAGLAVALVAGGVESPGGLVVASAALALAYRALPPSAPSAPTAPTTPTTPTACVTPAARVTPPPPRRGMLPLRMAAVALLVAVLSAAAGAFGPLIGGMLSALPVLACVLAVFTHRECGPAAVIALLRGMLAGMASFVIFCQLIAMLIGRYGTAAAFASAASAAIAIQLYSVHSTLRRQSSAPSAALATAAGSLRRQSS